MVALGSEELVKGVEAGSKVRVCKPVTVYHSPKLGDFNLEGKEGTVMDVRYPSPSYSKNRAVCGMGHQAA